MDTIGYIFLRITMECQIRSLHYIQNKHSLPSHGVSLASISVKEPACNDSRVRFLSLQQWNVKLILLISAYPFESAYVQIFGNRKIHVYL